MRNIVGRVEVTVAWGIEWEIWVRFSAVILAAISDSTEVPEGPTRRCRCTWDIPRVGLKEIDLVQRSVVVTPRQESEEDQQDGACHKEQAHKAQRRSFSM